MPAEIALNDVDFDPIDAEDPAPLPDPSDFDVLLTGQRPQVLDQALRGHGR